MNNVGAASTARGAASRRIEGSGGGEARAQRQVQADVPVYQMPPGPHD